MAALLRDTIQHRHGRAGALLASPGLLAFVLGQSLLGRDRKGTTVDHRTTATAFAEPRLLCPNRYRRRKEKVHTTGDNTTWACCFSSGASFIREARSIRPATVVQLQNLILQTRDSI